jgi:hypothetical protein
MFPAVGGSLFDQAINAIPPGAAAFHALQPEHVQPGSGFAE